MLGLNINYIIIIDVSLLSQTQW